MKICICSLLLIMVIGQPVESRMTSLTSAPKRPIAPAGYEYTCADELLSYIFEDLATPISAECCHHLLGPAGKTWRDNMSTLMVKYDEDFEKQVDGILARSLKAWLICNTEG
ncbi:hypothetical protein Droror1_Dr00010030 [Drosera rotundifolia]